MTSTEVNDGLFPFGAWGLELEKINGRLVEAYRLIKELNVANRQQVEEISDLRRRLDGLNHEVGCEYQGTRVIPRAAAGKLLHRTPRTLQRWEELGRLNPLYPFPNQVYYRQEEVVALVNSFGPSA